MLAPQLYGIRIVCARMYYTRDSKAFSASYTLDPSPSSAQHIVKMRSLLPTAAGAAV
jgi:hypothetical protein